MGSFPEVGGRAWSDLDGVTPNGLREEGVDVDDVAVDVELGLEAVASVSCESDFFLTGYGL
jgi:hypothetical protein